MKHTIDNDVNLFESATAAKIVQIKTLFNGWEVGLTAINSWCDGCRRIIGARIYYSKRVTSSIPAKAFGNPTDNNRLFTLPSGRSCGVLLRLLQWCARVLSQERPSAGPVGILP